MRISLRRAFGILAAMLAGGLFSPFISAEETFGSWAFAITDDEAVFIASTVNDSGAILGQFCYPKDGNCVWMVAMSTACDKGHRYPVLANADSGSVSLEILCGDKLSGGKYTYTFADFDRIDALIKQGIRVGFAIPMQEDQFRVVRFPLNGATKAIASMRAAANRTAAQRPNNKNRNVGTQDQDI